MPNNSKLQVKEITNHIKKLVLAVNLSPELTEKEKKEIFRKVEIEGLDFMRWLKKYLR